MTTDRPPGTSDKGVEAVARWIREHRETYDDHCGGEPTNPQFFGRDSEDDRAGPDGHCRGCWICWGEDEIAYELLLAGTPHILSHFIERLESDGARRAGTEAGLALPDDGSEDLDSVTGAVLRAAIQHAQQTEGGEG